MQHLKCYLLALFTLSVMTSSANAEETIKLQLKWHHQFQFAGYYAAKEKGFYQNAGLNVEIIEGSPDTASTEAVINGNAKYGVGNSDLLLSRNSGNPLVVLAVIFQHSPFILIAQQHSPDQNIHDLSNKHLAIEPHANELIAYLKHEGMPTDSFKLVEYKHRLKDFIAGKVDALSSYSTTEPYFLNKKSIKFHSYSPRSVGIDFYGDNLFTTEEEIKNNPERVRKFREASLQGWHYAMKNKDEIIELMLKKYPRTKDRDFLAFEAEKMHKLIRPEFVDIGYMLPGRWQHIADIYKELGMLPNDFSLKGFLYEHDPKHDYSLFYTAISITLFVLAIVSLISFRFAKLNLQLIRLLHLKSRFSNIGESINNISHQWKQPLNELGIQFMLIEQTLEKEPFTDNDKRKIKDITNKSNEILEFMANTVSTFGQIINTSNKVSSFSSRSIIEKLLQLMSDTFRLHKISIDYDLDKTIQLKGTPADFTNIILSILNNSRDIFLQRQIKNPHIHIKSYKDTTHYYIEISDNAGGIIINPIDSIFNLGVTEKTTEDSGIGLYISKQLIVKKFGGKINAENNDSGAIFKISIPQTYEV